MENNEETKRSMNEEERKQAARRVTLIGFDQTHSDFAFAMALQEQERDFNDIASTTDEEEEESESSSEEEEEQEYNVNDYEFFENQEMEFLEGQDSNNSEEDYEMEEDDIDPDELSYEELIALGEFIGEEKRGLTMEQVSKSLKPLKYNCVENRRSGCGIDRCVICQVEYEGNEELVSLPCDHPYHFQCISNWLQIKKLCPICSSEVSPTPNISGNNNL